MEWFIQCTTKVRRNYIWAVSHRKRSEGGYSRITNVV